jgi:hypothetical protein
MQNNKHSHTELQAKHAEQPTAIAGNKIFKALKRERFLFANVERKKINGLLIR